MNGDLARARYPGVGNEEEAVTVVRGQDAGPEVEAHVVGHHRDQLLPANAGPLLEAVVTRHGNAENRERHARAVDLQIRSGGNVDHHGRAADLDVFVDRGAGVVDAKGEGPTEGQSRNPDTDRGRGLAGHAVRRDDERPGAVGYAEQVVRDGTQIQ